MMKKTLLVMLAILLAVSGILIFCHPNARSSAEPLPEEHLDLRGVVTAMEKDHLLMTDTMGRLLKVLLNDSTQYEGNALFAGDYIQVTYNGMMSRSVPAVIGAEKISCHRLQGVVTEVNGEGFVLTDLQGVAHSVISHAAVAEEMQATAFFLNDANEAAEAWMVRCPELVGSITGVMEDGFLLEIGTEEVVIHLDEETILGMVP